jgi:SPP1 gp7 family putative phage head morphogenesis protein
VNWAQHLLPKYYEGIESQLDGVFYEILFAPLLAILQLDHTGITLGNSAGPSLWDALRSGRVQYQAGTFSGSFAASISKVLRFLGAKFNARTKTFTIDQTKVPNWVLTEAQAYRAKAKAVHDKILVELDKTQKYLDHLVEQKEIRFDHALEAIDVGFAPLAHSLSISPQLRPETKAVLAQEYTENMKLYVKTFSKEEIIKLRQIVEKNAQVGYRFDVLVDGIKSRNEVSKSKAKFLARQETSLYMSKFRQGRFSEAGVRSYKWSTSQDKRVRDDHKDLNNREFFYSSPPIVDKHTGRRANPGEDFNCRCVDIPILSRAEVTA